MLGVLSKSCSLEKQKKNENKYQEVNTRFQKKKVLKYCYEPGTQQQKGREANNIILERMQNES